MKSKKQFNRQAFTIKQLKSGFYSVWLNGNWINASLPNEAAAEKIIDSVISSGSIYQF